MGAPKLLKTSQVAERLNVKESTCRWWRHIGQGPESFKLRGSVVYREDRLQEWIAAQENASRSGQVA